MEKGLIKFEEHQRLFEGLVFQRIISSGLITAAWFVFAHKSRMIRCPTLLQYTLPVVFVGSYYFTKGFFYNCSAIREKKGLVENEQINNLECYLSELRKKENSK